VIRNLGQGTIKDLLKFDFKKLVAISITLWLTAILTKVFQNGLSFGLDYGVFQPDGAHYYFRTLTFLTQSDLSAAQTVAAWYQEHGVKLKMIDPITLLPEYNSVWYLSAPRILYPILSIPFVHLFGAYGMLIIPSLSLLGIFLIINWISLKYRMPMIGILLNFVLAASITVGRWFFSNITDGLLAFLIGLYALLIVRRKDFSPLKFYSFLIVLVALSSATRFSFPIWFFLGLASVIYKNYREAFVLWFSSILGLIPLLFLGVGSAVLPAENGSSWILKLAHIPVQSGKVLFFELAQHIILDKILLVFLLMGCWSAWKVRGTPSGLNATAVLLGVLVIGSINGTVGVNFRYHLPVIVFFAVAIFEYLKRYQGNSQSDFEC
jgi:hypothetical protein